MIVLVASYVLGLEGCADEGDGVDNSNFKVIVGELVLVWVVDVVEVITNTFDKAVAIAIPGDLAVW